MLQQEARKYYDIVSEEATQLYDLMGGPAPENTDLEYYWENNQFNIITWINTNCLEAEGSDLLLATGGPAYGVSLVHGSPVFWYQGWFEEKQCKQLSGKAYDFFSEIFWTLEQIGV